QCRHHLYSTRTWIAGTTPSAVTAACFTSATASRALRRIADERGGYAHVGHRCTVAVGCGAVESRHHVAVAGGTAASVHDLPPRKRLHQRRRDHRVAAAHRLCSERAGRLSAAAA